MPFVLLFYKYIIKEMFFQVIMNEDIIIGPWEQPTPKDKVFVIYGQLWDFNKCII